MPMPSRLGDLTSLSNQMRRKSTDDTCAQEGRI